MGKKINLQLKKIDLKFILKMNLFQILNINSMFEDERFLDSFLREEQMHRIQFERLPDANCANLYLFPLFTNCFVKYINI
jgi:hypothetical protein